MHRIVRLVFAMVFGVSIPFIPTAGYAGGGVSPGSGRGGGGPPAAMTINVDHTTLRHHNFDFLDYYPRQATVHQGDTVDFHWVESNGNLFHTVTLVPANTALSGQALARFFPGGGGPVPDKDDTPNHLIFPYNNFQTRCGNSPYFPGTAPCNYDGSTVVNSGVEFVAATTETGKWPKTKPSLHWSVTMNVRPGTYHYFCLVHGPDMSGSITVVPSGVSTPSAATQAQSSVSQFKTQVAQALAADAAVPAPKQQSQGGHTTWSLLAGADTPRTSKVEIDQFYARHLSINAGDTVVWQPRGLHTVTFPVFAGVPGFGLECETPGSKDQPFQGDLTHCALEAGIGPGIAPAAFPTGPSGQPYTGGFSSSGLLVVPKPHPWAMSFPKPGTYRYQCLVHWNMVGSITVH